MRMSLIMSLMILIVFLILRPVREAILKQVLQGLALLLVTQLVVAHHGLPLAVLFISQETLIQEFLETLVVQVLADEDELLTTVSPLATLLDVMLNKAINLFITSSVLLRRKSAEPRTTTGQCEHGTSLRPLSSSLRSGSKEEFALGAEETGKDGVLALVGENDGVFRCEEFLGVEHGIILIELLLLGGAIDGGDCLDSRVGALRRGGDRALALGGGRVFSVLVSINDLIILCVLVVNHLKILFILLIVFLITVLLRMLQLQDKLVIHQRPKASGVKRPTASIDAAADRVLLRLGLGGEDVAAVDLADSHVVEVLEPAVAGLGDL
jgi:hypothetical protein